MSAKPVNGESASMSKLSEAIQTCLTLCEKVITLRLVFDITSLKLEKLKKKSLFVLAGGGGSKYILLYTCFSLSYSI